MVGETASDGDNPKSTCQLFLLCFINDLFVLMQLWLINFKDIFFYS